MKKIYYYLKLEQKSPLRLGCGDGEFTDSDLKTDGRGLPYIPGSSLAGVLRSGLSEPDAKLLFGDLDIAASIESKENVTQPSKLIVSGAELKPDADRNEVYIMSRDGVGVDEWGLALDKAKYDFQVVETELPYYAVIEWSGNEEEKKQEIEKLLEPYFVRIMSKGLSFGARTSRGYGLMDVKIRKKEFTFPEQLETWLDYNPMAERFDLSKDFNECGIEVVSKEEKETKEGDTLIEIQFEVIDSFNIRVRTSRQEALPDGAVPDSVPLMNAKGKPVIPGTAWAGSFRHQMHRILRESGMEKDELEKEIVRIDHDCFGKSNEKAHVRSGICFSETEIMNGNANTIMRNAVDRFSAAPKNTGLFTNQVWAGGEGVLRIRVGSQVCNEDRNLLGLAIMDMSVGLLTIGGEAGIGRGIMKIESVSVEENCTLKCLLEENGLEVK